MITRTVGATAALTALLGFGGYSAYDAVPATTTPVPSPTVVSSTAPQQTKLVPILIRTNAGTAPASASQTKAGKQQRASGSTSRKSRRHASKAGREAQTGTVAPTVLIERKHQRRHAKTEAGRQSRQDSGSAKGGNQLVATQGSIILVGDNAHLIANTGETSSSGVVALGVDGSSLASGTSRSATTDRPTGSHANASFASVAAGNRSGASSTAVSGFEDHSVSVLGDDQLVTYDDSNVFINRNGQINANTGDTDSSGLNAIDVTDSKVRAGNSGDGEDHEAGEDDGEEEQAPGGTERTGPVSKISTDADETGGTDAGSDDEGAANEAAAEKPAAKTHATVTDEGESSADGDDTLVVGSDGFDDVAVRSSGNRNLVSYDDSNVIIGGTGNVNAQVGDADTAGAVIMGVHGSDLSAGCEGDLCGGR